MRSLAKNKLAKVRLSLFLLQADFAKCLGIAHRTLSKFENEPEVPQYGPLIIRLHLLGVNPFYLYDDKEEMFEPGENAETVMRKIQSII